MIVAKTGGNRTCPLCQGSEIGIFMEIPRVPVLCNVLWPSRQDAANAARGDLKLGLCRTCGHIYNYAFDPDLIEYSQGYENALHFSPQFQDYARSLAQELVDLFSLHSKSIVSIGCGDGVFLDLLCELGDNKGVGFDPALNPRAFASASNRIKLINDTYSKKYTNVPVDFVSCRHVLEHIPSPRDFLHNLREILETKGHVNLYFEVPNVRFNLSEHGLWDLIYEHCSYFGASSLKAVFRLSGFTVLSLKERYEGQFLTITASRSSESMPSLDSCCPDTTDTSELVQEFQIRHKEVVDGWRRRLADLQRTDSKIVVWGIGSKGVSFLNILAAQEQIQYVVDINPRKQGMYVAGTGQEIKSPEFLKAYRPDVIIIMNRVYKQEIQQFVQELGLHSELLSV